MPRRKVPCPECGKLKTPHAALCRACTPTSTFLSIDEPPLSPALRMYVDAFERFVRSGCEADRDEMSRRFIADIEGTFTPG